MVYATELGIKVTWDDSRVQAGITHTQADIKGFISNVRSSISQGIGMALGQIGFNSVIDGTKRLVMGMIDANAQWEDFNSQFEVMLGSADRAKSLMAEIQDMAKFTPFETTDLADATKTLLAFGSTQEEIMPTLKMLGDVAMGNKQKFGSLTLAFGQMKSAGRLMGQDLLQMINAGFNPLQIISEKTGISMGELKKQMEQGAISSRMVEDAFRTATTEGGRFFGGMEKGSQTFNGLKSTLQDAVAILMREIGAPFFEKAKKGLIKVIDYVSSDEGKEAIKNFISLAGKAALFGVAVAGVAKAFSLFKGIASFFGSVGEMLITMAGKTGAVIGLGRGATMAAGAMGGLRVALAALTGPIGWVITAITLLVSAYVKNFAGFRDFVNGMVADAQAFVAEIIGYFQQFAAENQELIEFIKAYWEMLKKWWAVLFQALMDVVKYNWELIKNVIRIALNYISGIIKFWKAVFQGDWEGAWEAAKETLVKVWAGFQLIVANGVLAILSIVKKFGNFFAGMLGKEFTGLDGAIEAVKKSIKGYEAQVKVSNAAVRKEIKATVEEQKKAVVDQTVDWSGFGAPPTKEKKGKGDDEAKKRQEELQKALEHQKQLVEEHRRAMQDLWKEQLRLNGARESEIFQWEYLRGVYPEMTQKQYEQRLEAMQYNEALRDRLKAQDESTQKQTRFNDSVRDYLEQAKQQLAFAGMTTERERVLWEIREGKYKAATMWQRIFLVAAAEAVDKDAKNRAGMEAYKTALAEVEAGLAAFTKGAREAGVAQMMLNGMTREQAEEIWGKQETLKGMTSYSEKMKEINDQLREMALSTREAAVQQLMLDESMTRAQAEEVVDKTRHIANAKAYREALKELNLQMLELVSTGKEWQVQQLMADQQLTRAQAEEIVVRKQQIEALKEYREQLKETATDVTDIFMDALADLRQGFGGFYKGVLDGFRKMLVEMAMAYIRSQVYRFIFNLFGSFGSPGRTFVPGMRPGSFGGFRASGGHMNARAAYVVGEYGPELVRPDSSSHVYDSRETAKILSKSNSEGVTINLGGITMNGVQDFESFRKNRGQMASDLFKMLDKAARRNR